jgi:hypothetical protein
MASCAPKMISFALHPRAFTPHPTSCRHKMTSFILHPRSFTPHPTSCRHKMTSFILHLTSCRHKMTSFHHEITLRAIQPIAFYPVFIVFRWNLPGKARLYHLGLVVFGQIILPSRPSPKPFHPRLMIPERPPIPFCLLHSLPFLSRRDDLRQ